MSVLSKNALGSRCVSRMCRVAAEHSCSSSSSSSSSCNMLPLCIEVECVVLPQSRPPIEHVAIFVVAGADCVELSQSQSSIEDASVVIFVQKL